MAALDLQEQEQVEGIKAWWKENGTLVTSLILVLLVGVAGWRGWQYYQNKQAAEAATLFVQFEEQLASNDSKRINDASAALTDRYPSSLYAAKAALTSAQLNQDGKRLPQAKTQLTWVLEHAKEPALKDVARLRLAGLLLDEKNYAEALKLLEAEHPASFDALFADLKGDVLAAQGKTAEARTAYKLALDKFGDKSNYRNILEMKLDALGAEK